ncbi:MAG: hypothetical protein CMJ34_04035 [Phycisphaerae bacterium]|nr:hypothetical protein [Phycisphaerae bacterium]
MRTAAVTLMLVPMMFLSMAGAGDPCGDPAAGACDDPNNIPGCDDQACCEIVCKIDPFCCEGAWDDVCVQYAGDECDDGGPSNDDCDDAMPVGEGDIDFSTVDAESDGPELPGSCDEGFGTGFGPDIWYLIQPEFDTGVIVSTCGAATFDTRLAAYTDCTGTIVACNDDGEGCPNFSSYMTFPAAAGQSYLIRVGGYGTATGTGTLSIEFGEIPPPYPTSITPVWAVAEGGNDHAYGVVVMPKDSSFADALATADRFGAQLASTTSPEENEFIVRFATTANPNIYDRAAFGLVQDPKGPEPAGGWGWTSGESLVWTNWRPGEPNDNPAPEDFGEFYENGEWNDCFDDDFGQVILEFEEAPNLDDGVVWPVSEGGTGHRYQPVIIYPRVDWSTAKAMAEEAGGRLASFETAEELAWVHDNLVCFGAMWEQPGVIAANNGPFVGLENIGGTWTWSSGEPLDYDLWYPGEPSGDGTTAGFFVNNGDSPRPTLNDNPSDTTVRSFIIEFEDGGGTCPTDLNGDGTTNGEDFGLLLVQWGLCEGCPADLDGDGTVGGPDVGLLLVGWGPCP